MEFEVCVDTVEASVIAILGGCSRLEVCGKLNELGGITPSVELIESIVYKIRRCPVPLMIMIRPEGSVSLDAAGNDKFCIEGEKRLKMIKEMKKSIEIMARYPYVKGFVLGFLNADGTCDTKMLDLLSKYVYGINEKYVITFHRAIDVCSDIKECLDGIMSIRHDNIRRILTSGHCSDAMKGVMNIKYMQEYVKQHNKDIRIIAGGGVNPKNVKDIVKISQIEEVHSSCQHNGEKREKKIKESIARAIHDAIHE